MENSNRKNIFIALLVMLLWGSIFPIVKIGYTQCKTETIGDLMLFAAIRFLVSGVITSACAFRKEKTSFKLVKNNFLTILVAGIFAVVFQNALTYPALRLTETSNAAILKQCAVLFYVAFSFLFFKNDKPTLNKIIGVILGFGGIVVMNYTKYGISLNIGNLLMLAASFCIVISTVIYKHLFEKINPLTVAGISQFLGGAILLLVALLMGGRIDLFSKNAVLFMLYICIASTISYALWYTVLKKANLSNLLIIKFAEPIFSCVFAYILLGENIFNFKYLLSAFLIFGGIYISNKKGRT